MVQVIKGIIVLCYGLSIAFWAIVWLGAFGDHPVDPTDITFHHVVAWLGLPVLIGIFLLMRYAISSWGKMSIIRRILVSLPALVAPILFWQPFLEFIVIAVVLCVVVIGFLFLSSAGGGGSSQSSSRSWKAGSYWGNDQVTYGTDGKPSWIGNDRVTYGTDGKPSWIGNDRVTYGTDGKPSWIGNDRVTYGADRKPTWVGDRQVF